MKIVIYTTSDFPYGGAAENLVREMTLGLHFHKVKVKIIRLKGSRYKYINDTDIPSADLITSIRPNTEILKGLFLFFSIIAIPFSIIKNRIFFKNNVVILYGIDYPYLTIPFIVLCKILNIRLYRLNTDYYDYKTIAPSWWKRPKIWLYRAQIKYIDKYFNGLVVLSNYLYRIAIENDTKEDKVLIIPHFIDTEVFSNIYIHDSIVNDKIKICFCGTASEQNGILDLANSFDLLKEKRQNISLIIVGELSDDICSKMKSILRNTDTSDINVTGFLCRTDVLRIIKGCDILVNPRKSGARAEAGFPTKLGEYFSSKKAVVSTDTGDISKYCNNWNELVIVPPDSPESMANAISALIEDELKASEIGLNGYKWAAQNLDSRINAEKLLIFLRENEK